MFEHITKVLTGLKLIKFINSLIDLINSHLSNYNNPHKVTAEQLGLSNAYKYKGSVPTYQDLPSTAESGDVYNVVKGDKEIGVADEANFAWNGSEWDNLGGLYKVTAEQLGLATVYTYKDSVATYADLPTTGQKIGDVYNVETADPGHGIKAGDNVAWNGTQWDILGGNQDLSGYAQLNSANKFTALNTFGANIIVSNGTAAGSQGQVILGVKPSTATVQANIISSTTGALNYISTENTGHTFRIGNNVAATSITTNEGESAIFSHNAFEFARVTNVGVARWLGNANTATKLEIARTINGVAFDGTQDITINCDASIGSGWTVSEGAAGWARENTTGFTIQWWVGNTDAIYRSITYPRSFSTLYYANVIASSNCETFVTGVSNTSISFCLCNGYNDDRWSGSQPCRLYACGLT